MGKLNNINNRKNQTQKRKQTYVNLGNDVIQKETFQTMTAKEFYNSINYLELEFTCVNISCDKWESIMGKAKRANKITIHKLLKKFLSGLYDSLRLNLYNPYEYYKTDSYLIVVHSAIEYFIKINN